MKKIVLALLLLLTTNPAWPQSRPIVPGDVGIQVPFGAIGNVLQAGPGTSQIQDSGIPSALLPGAVFNITSYGAKCDGVTNDNAAINAAFAAAAYYGMGSSVN
jgi:hypothetical protein